MKARDVMVAPVITFTPTTAVSEIAKTFAEKHISGAPVVDEDKNLIGIVSEGDLLHRVELGTERQRSWWLELFTGDTQRELEFAKAHGRTAADIMVSEVVSARPETPLHELATLMEQRNVKRVPIVSSGGQLVGIVTRSNLVQALAAIATQIEISGSDAEIRKSVIDRLHEQSWVNPHRINVTVQDGVVDLWGVTESPTERNAVRIAAQEVPGVRAVSDHLIYQPAFE